MEINQTTNRIHPLVAGAAASVMLVSLVGVAAITGMLPSSHGTVAAASQTNTQPAAALVPAPTSLPSAAVAQTTNVPVAALQPASIQGPAQRYALVPIESDAPTGTAPVVREVVEHRTVVHDQYVQHAAPRHSPHRHAQYAPAQVYTQHQPYYSPLGIGLGAVAGGLAGSRVGGGNGKTLATIAGAVGGGYLGNEVAKRYP